MKFTPQQEQAIQARGNVLVIAGAGTGKTRTLVERCLNLLSEEQPPVSLEEILMVTFTEAAAAEMRRRIRQRLEEELVKAPQNSSLENQLALFEVAHIGTLHGFCLKLVRQHFYELELDPQLNVLPEEEARLLAHETLDAILREHYEGEGALAGAVQDLIQTEGRGWDKPIRALVSKLHNYTQTLPDAAGWFEDQIKMFESTEPQQWRVWLDEFAAAWRESSLDFLKGFGAGNILAVKAAEALQKLPRPCSRAELAETLGQLSEIPALCPRGKKGVLLDPLEKFFDEAGFLFSVAHTAGGVDPLAEDWNWSRPNLLALLRLAKVFGDRFAEAKRELGAVDFHDLEQHTLRLLWDGASGRPTVIAQEWRKRLRFIFVDEYQDINAAQDRIIAALSGEGGSANRFLVGDVKQSIYRFRLANPRIFQHYSETWQGELGQTIPLTENFRSREGVIDFVNSLFALVLRREAGGLDYDAQAQLRFGAAEERRALGVGENPSPRVELHLRFTGGVAGPVGEDAGGDSAVAELEDAHKEARLVALRLGELKRTGHPIWDETQKVFRAVEWSDMAVLLRSPSGKAEIFAREFSQLGVPLTVARGGFFTSVEISDLLSLLQVLDNPLQDLPVLAVLHSPLVGLTLNELAAIRLAAAKVPFWTALVSSQQSAAGNPQVADFLRRFDRWRKLARQVSLSRCLEAVLAETHYAEWLLTKPRGGQQHANVQRLLSLAQQFDQFQRQGLFRFLRFVEAQQAADLEPDVAAVTEENAVRLMSIHQSKGLEFPVVVVANLGKSFNFSDVNADLILDEEFGLCPQIKPPHTGSRYPSLPHWLAQQRQRRETLGEESRLLYVATTRARDTLILTASLAEKKFDSHWHAPREAGVAELLAARSYADWLGIWFAANPSTRATLLRHEVWDDARLAAPETGAMATVGAEDFTTDPAAWSELEQRLLWKYPFTAASQRAAKVSVSVLRREAADEEAEKILESKVQAPKSKVRSRPAGRISAADIGTAHHKFLQCVALERTGDSESLRQEARRLEAEGTLSAEAAAVLDFKSLTAFWQSELGCDIRALRDCVHRELAFTARFSLPALAEITGKVPDAGLDEEFVVVQGVADLAVILENEIWLVDFKTDDVRRGELAARAKSYAPQLRLYASALARIYGRPVVRGSLYFLSLDEAVSVI